jgi:enoyl-CoA hydratase/carnithine racemase
VTVSIRDHVAEVTLNRADKHNALDLAMFEALAAAGDELAADASVRAVVLGGAGDNFCAGIDTSLFAAGSGAIDPGLLEPRPPSPANLFQRAAYVWREVPVPVICAIRGVAYGGGLQVALGADLRFARPDAKLSIMEIRWGLIPDMAITTTLARCMRADRLKELAFTGRVVDGAEAERLGLVTAVHEDPLAAARSAAESIAGLSPDAIRGIKRLFDEAWSLPDADALRLEAGLQLRLLGGGNQREAVAAAMGRREPQFRDAGD